ncbi:MAG: mechanosensitive ion channel family protein [Pontibacterium sp.]
METWYSELIQNTGELGGHAWALYLTLVFVAASCLHVVLRIIFRRLVAQTQKSKIIWDDIIVDALQLPALVLLWLVAFSLVAQVGSKELALNIPEQLSLARKLVLVATLAWFVARVIGRFERAYLSVGQDGKLDATTIRIIGRLLRLTVLVISGLVVLQTFDVSISGVLAFGGVGGIAIGFAAKDLLANFFGGLMIYLDQPFRVGDWIRSPDRDIEGTVEDIGWRQTRIRTFSKRALYVPNSAFANIAVENPSRMTHRRLYEYVGIRYEDSEQIEQVLEAVRAMLASHEGVAQDQLIMVNFDRFGASSLDFFVYCYTNTIVWAEFHTVKEDIMLKIIKIIEKAGAEFAYPTQTLHVPALEQAHPDVVKAN